MQHSSRPGQNWWFSRFAILAVSALVLQGCATFENLQLPAGTALSSFADPERARLSIGSIGQIAAVYNPNMIAMRTRLPEEDAKVFAAGLLPDPQISFTFDDPLSAMAGLVNAYSLGFAYDFRALVLKGETIKAAELDRLQVALDVEWQTWQTMQQARDLYIQFAFVDLKSRVLAKEIVAFRNDVARLKNALATGDTTVDALGVSLVALSDAENQIQIVRIQRVALRNRLAALIGLRPEAKFTIGPLPEMGNPSQNRIDDLLPSLPERRPDLLALRAGYQSQNARIRGAILGQFPSLSVGLTRARDTAGLKTNGFGITLNLPIFDGNRGAIAVGRATRKRLLVEYQARLDTSVSEILGLKREIDILQSEIRESRKTLREINRIISRGANAYQSGDFPAQSYSALLVARYTRELAIADLRQQVWQAVNALVSVLGGASSTQSFNAPDRSTVAYAENGKISPGGL